jgi:hypothetical protein
MNTYENLVAAGAENCHPLFIGVVQGKRELLARDVDGTVYLTDAGKAFLAAVTRPPGKTASKKPAPQVQSANESADELSDIDLSE